MRESDALTTLNFSTLAACAQVGNAFLRGDLNFRLYCFETDGVKKTF
jgi:hypothetical protein